MTPKEKFCLNLLAEGPKMSWEICRHAECKGLNKSRNRFEWADTPLRGLRAKGFCVITRRLSNFDRAKYEITEAGLAALEGAMKDKP